MDSSGQCHQIILNLRRLAGWQEVNLSVAEFFERKGTTSPLNAVTRYERWGGANDGQWHAPGTMFAILLGSDMLHGQKEGSVWLSGVRVLADPEPSWASAGTARAVGGDARSRTSFIPLDAAELLSRFDSLTAKGAYAAARRYAEAQVAKPANAASSHLLEAAARVAKTLGTRHAAIRKGARLLIGKETDLRLKTGTMSGEVKKVTGDGLVVASVYFINTQRRERTAPLSWDALRPHQLDELAEKGGWRAAPAEKAVARAYIAFVSGDLDTTESAAGEAKGHPWAAYLKGRVVKARIEAAYTTAMDNARARMGLGNWKGAVESLEEALAAKPHAAEARKLLAEAESHIGPAPTLTLDLGGNATMELVYIKPGVFVMGGNEDPKYGWHGVEKPKHEVAITRGFYMGRHEVTRGQFAAFVDSTGHKTEAEREGMSWGLRTDGRWGEIAGASWRDPVVFAQTSDHPVVCVSWNDVKAFCEWAAARTRRGVRLPTEAEWEYACRAGTTTRFSFGDGEGALREYAWHHKNSGGQTHPVGQKKPNAWGLHDVHGNVWEWVADWYDAGYYAKSPRENPTGPDSGARRFRRLLRGGGWDDDSYLCRSAIRPHEPASHRTNTRGFRACVPSSPRGK
jgi:formylglycine-generating enzyme required for sulfatase activity